MKLLNCFAFSYQTGALLTMLSTQFIVTSLIDMNYIQKYMRKSRSGFLTGVSWQATEMGYIYTEIIVLSSQCGPWDLR